MKRNWNGYKLLSLEPRLAGAPEMELTSVRCRVEDPPLAREESTRTVEDLSKH